MRADFSVRVHQSGGDFGAADIYADEEIRRPAYERASARP